MIRLRAPAKINLSFEVLGKRADGYHEVRTVLQAIDLTDEIVIEQADEVSLTVEPVGAVPVEGNLVVRAAEALRKTTRTSAGAAIVLRKRVPVAAGLGGGSSDAAATLLGLRKLWDVDRDKTEVYRIAASLGSDVPFFLRGGTAIGSGRGDALELLPLPVERFAVVATPVEPADAAKTSRLYGLLSAEHYSDGASTGAVVHRILSGKPIADAMRNTFMPVASSAYRHYDEACGMFRTAGARHVLLAGAGPSLFTLVDDQGEGDAIARNLREQGLQVHVARLLGAWGGEGATA